jgi:ubiquinone biosynthesis protein
MNEGMVPDDCDLRALKEDLGDVFERYYNVDLDRIDLGASLKEFIALVQEHRIMLPSVFTLLIRCLIILEGVGRQLEPGFTPIKSMMPYAKKALEREFQPREIASNIGQSLWKNLWVIKSFPNDFLQFLHKIVKGKAEFRIDHQGLEEIGDRVNKGGSRLAMTILIAGVIVASALVIQAKLPPLVRGFSVPGVLGYAVSLASAVIVFFRIFKDIR